jgi:dihydrofolate reductase
MKAKISAIVATDQNFLIGKDNSMPWHLPADLRHFKQITTGHTIIMGRKTFESLPNGALPNRRNIVLSRNTKLQLKDAEVFSNPEMLLESLENESEVFIIGGANIYETLFPVVSKLYLTRIHHSFEGDTYFPTIDFLQWNLLSKEDFLADEKNNWSYSFEIYLRR